MIWWCFKNPSTIKIFFESSFSIFKSFVGKYIFPVFSLRNAYALLSRAIKFPVFGDRFLFLYSKAKR